ncbi:MAG: hypothetical protein ACWGNK_05545 [Desulfobacterales bacterium]
MIPSGATIGVQRLAVRLPVVSNAIGAPIRPIAGLVAAPHLIT